MEKQTKEIVISIILLTYNHAKTLRDALDSIFSQKIDVSYEVLIIDDGSKDGAKDILIEYKEKYPDIITLFVNEFNTGTVTYNSYQVERHKAKGKYFAFIEGDDYWIDNYKLMKQYEFLENNPAFSAVVSDVKCIDENGTLINGFAPYKRKESGIFTLEDYHRLENPGMGVTMLCRNPLLMGADWDIRYKADYMMGDMSFRAVLLAYGDIYQMKEATAVYRHVRRNGGGSFNSINLKNNWMPLRYVRYWIRIENYLKEQTKTDYRIEIIDEQIQPLSRQFKWKDLYIALKETKDKSRVRAAFLYHFVAVNGRRYTGEKCTYKTGGWHNFIRVRKPIVVFGAGDLATEFLNIYAWQMPVKFLVDNDCNKIGKSMKGYLVKEPREILHFMDEVVVLVANEKYEKDIINQLEGMGIHNYYCYYSMQRKRLRNRIVCKLVMET